MPVKEVRRLDRVLGKHPDVYRSFRRLSIQLIVSLFCLGSLCLLGGLLFQWTERGFEETYKCGVKRVRRDFILTLWDQSRFLQESDWKNVARRHLNEFEGQLYEAVEAGIHTYSGQIAWTLPNSILYAFSLVSTLGFSPLTTSVGQFGKILGLLFCLLGTPLFCLTLFLMAKIQVLALKLATLLLLEPGDDKYFQLPARLVHFMEKMLQDTKEPVLAGDTALALPIPIAFGLFLAHLAVSSLVHCLVVVLWDSPLNGLYFSGMTLMTVGTVDTAPENSWLFLALAFNVMVGMSSFSLVLFSIVGKGSSLLDRLLA